MFLIELETDFLSSLYAFCLLNGKFFEAVSTFHQPSVQHLAQ